MIQLQDIEQAMTVKLDDFLPEKTIFQEGIRRAPDRGFRLTKDQTELALKNALRYIHPKYHEISDSRIYRRVKDTWAYLRLSVVS